MSKSKVRITPNPAANTKVNETGQTTSKKRATVSGVKSKPQQVQMEMLFNKNNFIWMGGGILLVAIGLVLMSGGNMPSPDVWDETIIYSPVRMVIAPIFILAGLVIEVFAIFRK
ncbi:MAG: DUF3098 domain-containing protein [Saprospiraceae bacterium]|jgi:hypothetical protein|nr:DUF3098 domain-containing protein [Saprospiraceae bacterium]MDP4853717.1 DUF3098 domain-containing protein [Saprospiraceae bacterium]MDP4914699.1 DUF3098 domain-containing protein [Saprospiraceae bacterium]MDP5049109.1 DUF3098 domain-containing protein [Saprospiraceae bacterium]MDP5089761.1 DUF3098 domain-containing protein [Saprospiraceae bacterium]